MEFLFFYSIYQQYGNQTQHKNNDIHLVLSYMCTYFQRNVFETYLVEYIISRNFNILTANVVENTFKNYLLFKVLLKYF